MDEHAAKCKVAFDHKVASSHNRVINYKRGDLVQIHDLRLDLTLSMEAKLLPHWGTPHWVVGQQRNSYQLEIVQGLPIGGMFIVQCLWIFIPRPGTKLAMQQLEIESK